MKDFVLGFRTVKEGGYSRNGFKWPKRGYVSCKDFLSTRNCGNGLHFLRSGNGYIDLTNLNNFMEENLNLQVLKVPLKAKDGSSNIIALGGKSKCKECEVLYTGKDLRKVLSFTHNNFNKNLIRIIRKANIELVLDSNKVIPSTYSYKALFILGDNITVLKSQCKIINYGKNNTLQTIKTRFHRSDIPIHSIYKYFENVIGYENYDATSCFQIKRGNFHV